MKRPETILDFVSTFSAEDLESLYEDPFAVMTLFRSFPPLSRLYLMRLLPLGELKVSEKQLQDWVGKGGENDRAAKEKHIAAISRLKQLHVLKEYIENNLRTVGVNQRFRACMMTSLTGPASQSETASSSSASFAASVSSSASTSTSTSTSASMGDTTQTSISTSTTSGTSTTNLQSAPLPPDLLDAYAVDRWARMLHYMAGVPPPASHPTQPLKERLLRMDLMKRRSKGDEQAVETRLGPVFGRSTVAIPTPGGVAFLVKTIKEQVWEIVATLVDECSVRKLVRDEVVRLLFRLSFLRVVSPLISRIEECLLISASSC